MAAASLHKQIAGSAGLVSRYRPVSSSQKCIACVHEPPFPAAIIVPPVLIWSMRTEAIVAISWVASRSDSMTDAASSNRCVISVFIVKPFALYLQLLEQGG